MIKLRKDLVCIEEPSGAYVTPKKLEVDKKYLYKGFYKYRQIIGIDESINMVYYTTSNGKHLGQCTKQHFVSVCPYEATTEEVLFLDKKEEEYQKEHCTNDAEAHDD